MSSYVVTRPQWVKHDLILKGVKYDCIQPDCAYLLKVDCSQVAILKKVNNPRSAKLPLNNTCGLTNPVLTSSSTLWNLVQVS